MAETVLRQRSRIRWVRTRYWRNWCRWFVMASCHEVPGDDKLDCEKLAKRQSTRQTRRVLIGLFPELDGPGGVQRAGRHLASVMTEFASSREMECRILSLNDGPELQRLTVSGREIVFR